MNELVLLFIATEKLAVNWQNFARVRLQLELAFRIRP